MATNALGPDTANVVFNVPVQEKLELGRLANRLGISLSEFIRRAVAKKAAELDTSAALRIADARRRRPATIHIGSTALHALTVGLWLSAVLNGHALEMRRPTRGRRIEQQEAA